ncbi:MAG: phosphatase PAP2 family protein [Bacteroidota bacterium]|nr:phosphatase PAP2 family protein [Bacteroidota bacterium]MDP4233480.1 phosphatase PAP2 family protein [Bacteroidota bacterium]MDP4243358.1 phosphatase PAP2 family protein [Bacteroidota bacterium]MDP4287956.1 phosphatase PAP2 family protein [Bacteroidota bacterium]
MQLISAFFISLFVVSGSAFAHGGGDSTRLDSASTVATQPSLPAPSTGTDRREAPHIYEIITNLPSDERDWAVQNVKLKYWPQISLIAVSTAAMVIYDNQLWTPFKKEYERNKTFQSASDLFVDMGDGKFQFGLAGAFAGYGLIAGDARAMRTAEQVCEVILASGAVVQLLKHTTGRESPIDISTNPTGKWQFFPNQIDYLHHTSFYDAFPSGHLTTALATLTVIANNYPEQSWIRPVGYAACAGLAVGLVAQSIHWWSDYPLAIALGIGFGNLISPDPSKDVSVIDNSKKKDVGQSTIDKLLDETTLMPTYQSGGAGLAMSVRF